MSNDFSVKTATGKVLNSSSSVRPILSGDKKMVIDLNVTGIVEKSGIVDKSNSLINFFDATGEQMKDPVLVRFDASIYSGYNQENKMKPVAEVKGLYVVLGNSNALHSSMDNSIKGKEKVRYKIAERLTNPDKMMAITEDRENFMGVISNNGHVAQNKEVVTLLERIHQQEKTSNKIV